MPSDEPVGAQLPELLSLLGTAQGTQLAPIQIVRSGGDILDLERSLVQQEVLDGEIVRIMTDDEVPPPTEVSDISGLLTDMTDAHPGRWNDLSRLLGAGVLLAVSAVGEAEGGRQGDSGVAVEVGRDRGEQGDGRIELREDEQCGDHEGRGGAAAGGGGGPSRRLGGRLGGVGDVGMLIGSVRGRHENPFPT